jgi:hypothetical protein
MKVDCPKYKLSPDQTLENTLSIKGILADKAGIGYQI